MSRRFLHVANGHSTTATIQAAGLPRRTSVWCDVLYEGPVPADAPDEQLIEIRARFIGGDGPGAPKVQDIAATCASGAVIADHRAYDEVVLWYERDLFD